MSIIRKLAGALAVLAIALSTFLVIAPQATAKPDAGHQSGRAHIGVAQSAARAADGYVYAHESAYEINFHCRWLGNDTDWSTCTDRNGVRRSMLNQAGSLYNRGYAGGNDDVNFYWGKGYTGAWACLGVGDYWADLGLNRERFTWGAGRPGHGQSVNNNIASHKWVSRCGQA